MKDLNVNINLMEELNKHMTNGKLLYQAITNGHIEFSSLSLSEMIDFLSYGAYELGYNDATKGEQKAWRD